MLYTCCMMLYLQLISAVLTILFQYLTLMKYAFHGKTILHVISMFHGKHHLKTIFFRVQPCFSPFVRLFCPFLPLVCPIFLPFFTMKAMCGLSSQLQGSVSARSRWRGPPKHWTSYCCWSGTWRLFFGIPWESMGFGEKMMGKWR